MEKIQILSIGRDPVLLQKLSRFINENAGWESTATVDDETAIKLYQQRHYDIVLIMNNLVGESVNKLSSVFSFQNKDILIIKDVGDSTQILEDKINKALETRKQPVNIIDDAFKETKKDDTVKQ